MCDQLALVVSTNRGLGFSEIFDLLIATGASPAQVDLFLAADPDGRGSARDQIAADMTNQLMGALGQPGHQSAADVKRARQRGQWTQYDQRPPS